MEYRIQVMHLNKKISLLKALESGYVKIIDDRMVPQGDTILSLSSQLFDCNGNELFENDIVCTTNGEKYSIIYNFGVFCLKGLKNKRVIPLYIYKLGNTVDVEKL